MGEASAVIDSSGNSGSVPTKGAVDASFDLILGRVVVCLAVCGAPALAGRDRGSSVSAFMLPGSRIDSCTENSNSPELVGRLKKCSKCRAEHFAPRTADAHRIDRP